MIIKVNKETFFIDALNVSSANFTNNEDIYYLNIEFKYSIGMQINLRSELEAIQIIEDIDKEQYESRNGITTNQESTEIQLFKDGVEYALKLKDNNNE